MLLLLAQTLETIEPFDWHRIWIGEQSWLFTLEIVFRVAVIYIYTLLLIRFVSKRAVGQLSLVEFLLVIALGSAVGDSMFYPQVPLLHAMVVVTAVVLLNRVITTLINRNEAIETTIEGVPKRLVQDGLIDTRGLREAHLSREKLFEFLRVEEIDHLGQISAAYLEQSGQMSVQRYPPEKVGVGLRISPPWDLEPPNTFDAGDRLDNTMPLACVGCGFVMQAPSDQALPRCKQCGDGEWCDAVAGPSKETDPADPPA